MTAPSARIHITPEIVARFAGYHARNPSWGVLHVSFDDGNWNTNIGSWIGDEITAEERGLVGIHDAMTPSQRRRLCRKAGEALNVPAPDASRP